MPDEDNPFIMLADGWLSDRLRPRRVMLLADAARLLLMTILAALALRGHPTLFPFGGLLALAMLFGMTQTALREI